MIRAPERLYYSEQTGELLVALGESVAAFDVIFVDK